MNNLPEKNRAPYNRTLTISDKEIDILKKNLLSFNQSVHVEKIKNKIINCDLFDVLDYLPDNFIDLLFIDPPYNLDKKFNLNSFKEMDNKLLFWQNQ